jgi:hypothetical protein
MTSWINPPTIVAAIAAATAAANLIRANKNRNSGQLDPAEWERRIARLLIEHDARRAGIAARREKRRPRQGA